MTEGGRSWRTLAHAGVQRIQSLVSWCEGAPLALGDWAEPGVPVLLGVPLYLALPFATSGPLRAILRWSIPTTLPLALVLSAAVLAPVAAVWRRAPRSVHPRVTWAIPITVAFLSIFALYRRDFAGLTNYAGADGGVHVFQLHWFVTAAPNAYVGFVSMYGLQYWLEVLARCNVYWSLCIAYYFGVAVVAALPCVIALVVLEPVATRRAWWVGAVVCFASALALAWIVVLPQQHYHQTDGFFAHLFALVPLMVAWLLDSATRARMWRWLALVATLVFYRYTYGLNLADLVITVAALLFADSFAPGVPVLARWSLRVAPFPLGFVAVLFLRRLQPQLANYGWIVGYDLPTVVHAQCAIAVGIAITLGAAFRRSDARPLPRALRFPLVFILVNASITWIGWRLPHREPYYVYKYPLHGVVLAAGAMVVMLSAIAAQWADAIVQRRRRVRALWSAVGVVASIVAVVGWSRAYAPLGPMFRERVLGHSPYSLNHPLADLAAWRRIERVLDAEHKKFGGYITSYWPMFNFMNAALGYWNGGRWFWEHGGIRTDAGYCVFWDRGKVDWWSTPGDLPGPLRSAVAAMDNDGQCVSYRAYWNHAVERTLCHLCR